MPILTNTTDQPIRANTGHTVPARGNLTVSDATLDRISRERYIEGKMIRGALLAEADPMPEAEKLTRATIARATRAELLEIILAHGPDEWTADDFAEVTVEDRGDEDGLRTIAARMVFADI